MSALRSWLGDNWWWLLPLVGAIVLPLLLRRILPRPSMGGGLKMKIAQVGGTALTLLGAFALVDLGKRALAGSVESPFSRFILGGGLMVLGAGWLLNAKTGYRGGAYAVVGAIFLYAAAFNLALLADRAMAGPVPDVLIDLVSVAIFAFGGALLLKAGHARHIRMLGEER